MIGAIIFAACTWAVFSRRVRDDLIGRHCLAFAAIASAGYAYSGHPKALIIASSLLAIFAVWEWAKQPAQKRHQAVSQQWKR